MRNKKNSLSEYFLRKLSKTRDIKYFLSQKQVRTSIFLKRFPGYDYSNLNILDLGCGHGALSVELAERGAREVTGVDLNEHRIRFAWKNLQNNYPQLTEKITFICSDIRNLEMSDFDIIISKAVFEHIFHLEILLQHLKDKLKPGGKILAGIGPLYNSPLGHHYRMKPSFPWAHVVLPSKFLIRQTNKNRKNKISDIKDLGLNGYSLKKYKEILYNLEGLELIDFRTNVSRRPLMKAFRWFAHIPFLREYFTCNLYCVLKKS